MTKYSTDADVIKFAKEVIDAARQSYPAVLGPVEWPVEADITEPDDNGILDVYVEIPDTREPGRVVARMTFEVGIQPAGWTDPEYGPFAHRVVDGKLTIVKTIDGKLGFAELRIVDNVVGDFAVPAHVTYVSRSRLKSMSTQERQRWLEENPPVFLFPNI